MLSIIKRIQIVSLYLLYLYKMSYSTDLLDGFDTLYKRTEGVLKCNQEMSNFFRKLSTLESDYSKALLKLVKSTGQKKLISNPFLDGSLKESWRITLGELESIGNQHATFSNLDNDLANIIEKMVKDKENVRKKLTADGQKLTKDMKTQLDLLTKAKMNYHKLSKEAELAQTTLTKGQADPKMKQDKVSQLSTKASQASEKSNQADQEYRECLNVTNVKQNEYYMNEMPNLLKEFQTFEEDRISQTKDAMHKLSLYIKEIPPVVSHAADVVQQAAEQVDKDADIRQWVAENKTNVTPPGPIDYYPFEGEAQASNSPSNFRVGTYKPPTSQTKDWGLTPKDSGLTPDQKTQKLESQLSEISNTIKQEIQARAGIEKLIQFYANDPKEQKKAEGELMEADKKINALKENQRLISQQMEELGRAPAGAGGDFNGSASGGISQPSAKLVRVRGLYDYEASCDTELSFKEGDILSVTEQDSSGWWFAELNGSTGFVPQNYVELYEA
ncbi:hypothetical protein PPL_02233 [Heterostelium album PN500]|uniref:SH3 domain-containing protein n=1 Tax=Heterostelium pallidum (strain ATCC 26659 / Pp 5 / PN500) TaxID=670386 RepID=D3B1Q9_HETP5|nr:hypothetical protein PPL_02233 [Heterostelium album PN500]EFA85233.1 hypothetical protein PPL_02233 [Heterostelium album PN500]|eukprot:XP_020437342.1 hypothetical protein PPL_02233 [Heterostelium album PN500]